MAVHYEVPAGKNFVVAGPANVRLSGGEHPAIVDDLAEAQAAAPTIESLDPATAESGSADVVMKVTGTGFTSQTVIVFGEYDEPTTLNEDGTVSTGVKPSIFAPATVPVKVRNGPLRSNSVDFTFSTPPGARTSKKS